MKKKRVLALILAGVMTLSLAACGSSGSSTASSDTADASTATAEASEQPYAGEEITVIATTSVMLTTVSDHLAEFEEATGITVDLELYETEECIDKANVAMGSGGTGVDVVCYRPIQETQTWYANGYLEPLNDYVEAAGDDYDYDDFMTSAKEATTFDGNILGIPYLTECEMLWYNTELLEQYNVEVPTNFDELLAAAEALYDPDNNVYGIGLRGEGNGAVTQFSGFLYGFGGDFYDEDMNATMNTDEALAALEYYADLLSFGPAGSTTATMNDTINWFANGVVGMRIDCSAQTFNFTDESTSVIYDKLGYAMFPEGENGVATPFNVVAWAVGMASSSQHKDAAWEFIEWMTGKEIDSTAMKDSNFSARNSSWADEEATASWDPALVDVIEETGEIAIPYDRPHNANSTEARAVVGEMIDAANSGLRGDELKATVDALNDDLQAILDQEKE